MRWRFTCISRIVSVTKIYFGKKRLDLHLSKLIMLLRWWLQSEFPKCILCSDRVESIFHFFLKNQSVFHRFVETRVSESNVSVHISEVGKDVFSNFDWVFCIFKFLSYQLSGLIQVVWEQTRAARCNIVARVKLSEMANPDVDRLVHNLYIYAFNFLYTYLFNTHKVEYVYREKRVVRMSGRMVVWKLARQPKPNRIQDSQPLVHNRVYTACWSQHISGCGKRTNIHIYKHIWCLMCLKIRLAPSCSHSWIQRCTENMACKSMPITWILFKDHGTTSASLQFSIRSRALDLCPNCIIEIWDVRNERTIELFASNELKVAENLSTYFEMKIFSWGFSE